MHWGASIQIWPIQGDSEFHNLILSLWNYLKVIHRHFTAFFVFEATTSHVEWYFSWNQQETGLLWITYLQFAYELQTLNLTGSVFYTYWSLHSAETKAYLLKASYSLSTAIWNFQALLILTDHEIMIHNTIKRQGLPSCHKEMPRLQQTCNGYADLISSSEFEILFDWSIGCSSNEKGKLKTINNKKYQSLCNALILFFPLETYHNQLWLRLKQLSSNISNRLVRLWEKNGKVISKYREHVHLYIISKTSIEISRLENGWGKQTAFLKQNIDRIPKIWMLGFKEQQKLQRVKPRASILLHSNLLSSQLHVHTYGRYTQQHPKAETPFLCIKMIWF